MFDSRSKIVKIGGYVIIGFFTLIIIISFGVPDFMSRLGMDQSTIAVVNGEKIHYLEFLRYRDTIGRRYKNVDSKEFQQLLLNNLIRNRLQLQKAQELDIEVSDDKVKRFIRGLPMFYDKSGSFNQEYFKNFLQHYRMSISEYYKTVKEELVTTKMREMIQMGIGIMPEEVIREEVIDTSRLQMKYCYASNRALWKRFKQHMLVTDEEIEAALKKDRSEIKDPKTDRERLRKKLMERKFEQMKQELVSSLDQLALRGERFAVAAAKLRGQIGISREFKVGEPVRAVGPQGKVLTGINGSKIFRESFLGLDPGKASRVIMAADGLYIFTPTLKRIEYHTPSDEEFASIEQRLMQEKFQSIYVTMMTEFIEQSRIIKNINFDKKKQ